jgi:hypothetical protein
MISLIINPVLENYLQNSGFEDIQIYPINAYENSTAPFITWLEFPTTKNNEIYWMRQSNVTYTIYDNNLSNAKDISKKLEKLLNIGDNVSYIKSQASLPVDYTLCWSRMIGGGMFPPIDREGYASISRTFEIGYIEI